jgi:hypothetical protein
MILLLNAFLQQIQESPSLIIKLVVESLAIPAITIRHQKLLKIPQSNRIEVYCWNLYPLNKNNKIKKFKKISSIIGTLNIEQKIIWL